MLKNRLIRTLQRSLCAHRCLAVSAVLPAFLAGTALGDTLTWDPAFTGTGSDGSGIWGTTTGNWSNGLADTPWVNGSTASFGTGGTAGAITIADSVTVGDINFGTYSGTYTISGGSLGIGATSTFTTAADASIDSSIIGSSSILTKAGEGTLTLNSATSGISTINVTAGILQTATTGTGSFGDVNTSLVVSSGAAIRISAGAVVGNSITFNGGSSTAAYLSGGTLSGAINLASDDTKVNAGNASTISGVISGSGSLTLVGPNKLTVTGANTYSGGTTISDGILELAAGGTLGTGAVVNSTALELNTSSGDLTVANAISGEGSITKSGPGTATLSGSVTSSGYTIVSGGTLLINGTKSATSALVYVAGAGSVLGGTGTIVGASSGAITLLSGGAVAPGLTGSIGTLTATSLSWTSDNVTAGMIFDLSSTDNTSDLLTLTGAFTRSSGTSYIFDFQNSGALGQTYTLINYGSTSNTSIANLVATNLPDGLSGVFSMTGGSSTAGSLTFTVTAVPEVNEIGAAVAAFAGLAIVIRRRNRNRQQIATSTSLS